MTVSDDPIGKRIRDRRRERIAHERSLVETAHRSYHRGRLHGSLVMALVLVVLWWWAGWWVRGNQ